jgi:hypothetical protein
MEQSWVASAAGAQAADASLIPGPYSRLSSGSDLNKFYLPFTRGATKEMQRARRLTKDAI